MRQPTRQGFTLIELLVVIGIILVLILIVTLSMRHVTNTAARAQTQVELKLCMDMLTQYQAVNGLNNIDGPPASAGPAAQITLPAPTWLNDSFQLPIFVDSTDSNEVLGAAVQPHSTLALTDFAGSPIANGKPAQTPGGFGDMGDTGDFSNPRWVSNAVRWSQGIMFILLKDPKNRALVSNLPPARILETPPPITQQNLTVNIHTGVIKAPGDAARPPFTIDAALPLDGWGNPIVFVPRGGMHVLMDPSNTGALVEYVVRTSGVYPVKSGLPPINASDHPFFASAGQDRYFIDLQKKSDHSSDNVYSFQEQ